MKGRDIHDIAAQGYGSGDEDYERARPGYPVRAVELLLTELDVGPGRTVLDVGAGTGKFTRLLDPTGATLLALEPVAAMRRHLEVAVPEARVLAGTAERIPLPDRSVDVVVAATAFHWFGGDDALAEIARVLKPGGGLGLVWNNPDEDVDWVAAVWSIVGEKRGSAPRNRDLRWQGAFARGSSPFTSLRHERFSHEQEIGVEDLLARVRSIAFVASLAAGERAEVLERVRTIATTHPELAGRDRFELPYRTDVYWCYKR